MLGRLVERRAFSGIPPWESGLTIPSPIQDASLFVAPSHLSANAALKVTTVWSCVRLIADYLAAAPTEVFRKTGGVRTPMDLPVVLADPAAGAMTPHDWWFALAASLLLTGNVYAIKTGLDRTGYPTSLPLVDPTHVRPHIEGGVITEYDINGTPVPAELVLHMRAFMLPGKPKGVSPIEQFGQTIGMGLQAENFGYRFFSEGAIPSGIIYSDEELNDEQRQSLLDKIMDSWRGRRQPAVLGSGLKYERVSLNPGEAQFIESQNFTIEEICRIFGVPPEMVGHKSSGSSVTYANLEERQLGLQQFTLLPWAARIETALSTVIPRGQYVQLNLDHLIRISEDQRFKNNGRALRDGWMSPNEVRATRENLGTIPHGDEYLWPLVAKPAEEPDQPPPAENVPLPEAPVGGAK